MLARNFYKQHMGHGKTTSKRDVVTAPRLTGGLSKSTASIRGIQRGGRASVVSAIPRRQILVETNQNTSRRNDHDNNEGDSDKENEHEELEDLAAEQQPDEDEEEETEEELDWKCRLLKTIQLSRGL